MNSTGQPPESGNPPPPQAAFSRRTFRYSGVKLLVALGLFFATAPLIADLPHGRLIEALVLSLVMISALLAVGGQRRTFHIALVLIAPPLLAKWINHVNHGLLPPAVFPAVIVVFFGYVVAHLLGFILRVSRVDANVLCAGLSGYLLLGLLWTPLYMMVAELNPAAFTFQTGSETGSPMDGFNAFYFSFMTLCTVGYGDITPMSKAARMLAVTEAIAGLFYVAVLISRLVAVYSTAQPSVETDTPEKP
jgi:voltage-gated potassium channel